MKNLFYDLLLIRTPGIGPIKYHSFIKEYGSAENALDVIGVREDVKESLLSEMDKAERLNIKYISEEDELYPTELKKIRNRPPILSVRGNVETLKKPIISIVGTRHASVIGMGFVAELSKGLAEQNFAIASGMAMGTDTAAHIGALKALGPSQTVAVLAGGVDYIWPLENEALYYEILERGVVISEMPVGFVPNGQNFVQRNRWIAGIAQKIILGEADIESGSMKTIRFGMEYGKEIYAIPSHPADSRAIGPNSLIKSGQAKLCMGLSDFEKNSDKKDKSVKKVKEENILLDALGPIPTSESVLAEVVKKSISEIKAELVILELQGLVRKQDGGYIKL